jgi:hypothetical protein
MLKCLEIYIKVVSSLSELSSLLSSSRPLSMCFVFQPTCASFNRMYLAVSSYHTYQTLHYQTGQSETSPKSRPSIKWTTLSVFSLCCFESETDLLKTETDRQTDSISVSTVAMVLFHQETWPHKISEGKTVSFLDAKCNQMKFIQSDPNGCNSDRRNVQTLSPLSDTFGTQ